MKRRLKAQTVLCKGVIKISIFQLGIDEDSVKRLSGEFAVSIVDIGGSTAGPAAVKDLKVANSQLELHVLYGPRPPVNRYR